MSAFDVLQRAEGRPSEWRVEVHEIAKSGRVELNNT
jgi:hypothetical protein